MIIKTTYFTRTSGLIKRHDAVWHLLFGAARVHEDRPTSDGRTQHADEKSEKLGMPFKLRKARLRSSQFSNTIYSNIITAQTPVLEIR